MHFQRFQLFKNPLISNKRLVFLIIFNRTYRGTIKLENSAKLLVKNGKMFEKAVERAQTALKNEKLNSAVAWVQIGADLALYNHPGFYSSLTLESILLEIASRLHNQKEVQEIDQKMNITRANTNKRNILHVMTQGFGYGGHTRLVSAWIRNTFQTAVSSVVTTALYVRLLKPDCDQK